MTQHVISSVGLNIDSDGILERMIQRAPLNLEKFAHTFISQFTFRDRFPQSNESCGQPCTAPNQQATYYANVHSKHQRLQSDRIDFTKYHFLTLKSNFFYFGFVIGSYAYGWNVIAGHIVNMGTWMWLWIIVILMI